MLSRPDRTRVMHGYCPCCYKGKVGISGTDTVKEDDECIDRDQAMLSRRGNGLPILSMTSPGERCESTVMCKLLCLVCGQSMLDGDEADFEGLIEVLDELESLHLEFAGEVANCGLEFLARSMEKDMRKKAHRALREYGLEWIERWGKPVHSGCSQAAPCECVVPMYAEECAKHGRRIPPKRTRVKEKAREAAPFIPSKATAVTMTAKTMAPSGAGPSTTIVVTTGRATWLTPPSKMALTDSQIPGNNPNLSQGSSASASSSSSSAAAAGGGWRKTPRPDQKQGGLPVDAKKPYAHTLRGKLLKAASTCHKLDGGGQTGRNSTMRLDNGGGAAAAKASAAGSKSSPYDLRRHNSSYDPFVHGPFRKNGQYWFLRPDGKAIQAHEGVCEFTEEGDLIPC